MEKAVLPMFWQFLSNAGYGNAQVVMISVLPFISTLPDEVITPHSEALGKLGNIVGETLFPANVSPCFPRWANTRKQCFRNKNHAWET